VLNMTFLPTLGITSSPYSMVLDEHGGLYTFGSGASGALGHGDLVGQ
jgi:hypothetical protein